MGQSETRKRYNDNHREQINEYMNVYYQNNLETMRANNRASYERKKKEVAKRRAMWKLEAGQRVKLKTLREHFATDEVETLQQKYPDQMLDWV